MTNDPFLRLRGGLAALSLAIVVPLVVLSAQHAAPPAEVPKLQATFESMEQQQYCRVNRNDYAVFLQTKLRFTNVSSSRVLFVGEFTPAIRERVALSIQDAEQGHFLDDLRRSFVTVPMMTFRIHGAPEYDIPLTIDPGKELEIPVWSKLIARLRVWQTPDQRTPSAGKYTVQLLIQPSPYLFAIDPGYKTESPSKLPGEFPQATIATDFFSVELPLRPKAQSCEDFQAPIQ